MRQSGENYLEAIYLLSRTQKKVRAIDVARMLGYSKPSVSRAIGKLRELGMLEDTGSLDLVLSKEGCKRAKLLVERQELIAQFLMMTTDVDAITAQTDAAAMAHYISDKTYRGVKNFIKEVEAMNE